jgi:membrane protein insertase Oxa1/YidC/SpoIIIJ
MNHHPVIELTGHLCSPLTASLSVFLIHKAWQRAAMGPVLGALFRHRGGRTGLLGLGCVCGVACAWGALNSLPMRATHMQPPRLANPHTWRSTALCGDALHLIRGTGLPWWATITSFTLALRVLLAPVQIGLLQNSLRLKLIWPEVLRHCTAVRTAPSAAAQHEPARALLTLLDGARCSPFGQCFSFPILMPGIILSVFGAVHNLCRTEPGMAAEGALWFNDLTAPDETKLLPILSSLTWLANVEMGAGVYYEAWPMTRLAARLGAVAFIPMAEAFPSGVLLFWLVSNCFAIGRGALLRRDSVRRLLGIPLQAQIAALTHLPIGRHM